MKLLKIHTQYYIFHKGMCLYKEPYQMHESEGEGNDNGDVQTAEILKRGLLHMMRVCQELGNMIISTLSSTIGKRKYQQKGFQNYW